MAVRRRASAASPGQHFLRSSRLAADLVRTAEVGRGDLVLDIGAGSGALTRALFDAGARVVALELDPRLASSLAQRFAGFPGISVFAGDARHWPLPQEEFAVVSNLPFSGSSEILSRLLRDPSVPLRRVEAIVAWGLAVKQSRIWPATVRGTYWRSWYEPVLARRLSRSAFTPAPQVDAAVLRLTRLSRPLVDPGDHEAYWRFLVEAFGRDASLGDALRGKLSSIEIRRLAETLGFSPSARPRDLDAAQWAGVFRRARSREPSAPRSRRGRRRRG